MKKWLYLITWMVVRTIETPCPIEKDEFGLHDNVSRCMVFHTKQDTVYHVKKTADKLDAKDFLKRLSAKRDEQYPMTTMHGSPFNPRIFHVKLDSIPNN